jgi:hypothetical protein
MFIPVRLLIRLLVNQLKKSLVFILENGDAQAETDAKTRNIKPTK